MTSKDQPATPPASSDQRAPAVATIAKLRWWAALIVMTGPVLYATVRTIVVRMAHSRPELGTTAILIGSLLAAALLTYNLRSRLPETWGRRSRMIAFLAWSILCFIGMFIMSDNGVPRPVVALLFVLGTLWAPWIAWFHFDRMPFMRFVNQGLAVLAGLGVLGSTLTVSSMRGDNTVDFRWSWAKPRDYEIAAPQSAAAVITSGFEPGPNDFPGFLGPSRTGVIPAVEGLSSDWATSPPREVWRKTIGAGWSGFAVRGEYAITQEQRGDDEYVVCYRLADGEIVWSVGSKERFESPMGGAGPRATPTIADDGRIYALGGTGLLRCINGQSGQVEWSKHILKDNQGSDIAHGVCGSPLVDGDRVIVAPTGNPGVCLVAYQRLTGERLWQAGRHGASYSSPVIVDLAGRRQLLLHAAKAIESHDPETGEFLWEFEWSNEYDNNCSQPIVIDAAAGRIVITSGYGTGAALLEVQPTGSSWSVKPIWTSRDMATKFTTAVRLGDSIYGLDNGILAAIDLATGKRRWKTGRYGHGQILLVGERLLVQAENGDIALVDPQPQKFLELARLPMLNNKSWNNPAVSGRYILVRNAEEAVCLEWPTVGR